MTDKLTKIESMLGGKFERADERVLPGLDDDEDTSTLYFHVSKEKSAAHIFDKITGYTDPPAAKFGGVIDEPGCSLETPNGMVFHALRIHGDLEGWYSDISAGASAENVLLASIEGRRLVINNEQSFDLDECLVAFT